MGGPTPWILKRKGSSSNADWLVCDRATGEQVGEVFKYIGSWWADDAHDMTNRRYSRHAAADKVWRCHLETL